MTSHQRESLSDVRAEIAAYSRGSKSSIVRVLEVLQCEGLLTDDRLGGRGEKRAMIEASHAHGNASTSYGQVVQHISFEGKNYDYVNPFAFVCYLASLCDLRPSMYFALRFSQITYRIITHSIINVMHIMYLSYVYTYRHTCRLSCRYVHIYIYICMAVNQNTGL